MKTSIKNASAPATGAHTWSLGEASGTIYRDREPTGIEVKIYNTHGGTIHDLIAQANAAPELLTALRDTDNMIRMMQGNPNWESIAQDIQKHIRKVTAKATGHA